MGTFLIITAILLFSGLQWAASLTGEGAAALVFSIPILNFALLGVSINMAKDPSTLPSSYKKVAWAITLISLSVACFSAITMAAAYQRGVDLFKNYETVLLYFAYVFIMFALTVLHPFSNCRESAR